MGSRTQTLTADISQQLNRIGLRVTASSADDFIARATKHKWSPRVLLEEIVRAEAEDRSQRSLERRLRNARLGRFKTMADFDWNWPKKIDRSVIERALTLDFITEGRNLVLMGANGLGKTMITKNIAHQAVLAGHSVVFRTAPDLLSDLASDYPHIRRRKLIRYSRPALLCIDEVGYLSYDSSAADLLYEVINRRYERASILITTNRAFKDWDSIFPNAACIATLLDRLTHHADVTLVEGQSYRVRESEQEAAARRRTR
ncbi:MAG: IS21-like element helper ATPase IstB [Acidobacteriota bacterium]